MGIWGDFFLIRYGVMIKEIMGIHISNIISIRAHHLGCRPSQKKNLASLQFIFFGNRGRSNVFLIVEMCKRVLSSEIVQLNSFFPTNQEIIPLVHLYRTSVDVQFNLQISHYNRNEKLKDCIKDLRLSN